MDNQGIFKTCIVGGFEKESVLSYIEELNKKNNEILDEKQIEIESLISEKSELEYKISDINSELEKVTLLLNKEKDNMKTLNTVIASVNVDLEKSKQQTRKIENENILISEKYKQLQSKYENLSKNEHSFNDASVKLGSLLLEAQKTAEAIVQNSNFKSQEIKQETHKQVKNTVCKLESFKNDFLNMRTQIQTVLNTFDGRMNDIEESIDVALSKSKKITTTSYDKKQSKEVITQQKQGNIRTVRV